MTMGVFTIFFGRLAKLPSQGLPYPVFYFAALVPWAYFSLALTNCTNIVVENQNVITKVYFPRLILPVAAVLSGLVGFSVWLVVVVGVTPCFWVHPPAPRLLLPGFIVISVVAPPVRGAAGWAILLPANGNEYRRPRLESSDALCFGQLAVAVYLQDLGFGLKILRLGLFFELVDITVFDSTH